MEKLVEDSVLTESEEDVSPEQMRSQMDKFLKIECYYMLSRIYTFEADPYLKKNMVREKDGWMDDSARAMLKHRCAAELLRFAYFLHNDDKKRCADIKKHLTSVARAKEPTDPDEIIAHLTSPQIIEMLVGDLSAAEVEERLRSGFETSKFHTIGRTLGIEHTRNQTIDLVLFPLFLKKKTALRGLVMKDIKKLAEMCRDDLRLDKIKWIHVSSWIMGKYPQFFEGFQVEDTPTPKESLSLKESFIENSPGNPYPIVSGFMSKDDFIKRFAGEIKNNHDE